MLPSTRVVSYLLHGKRSHDDRWDAGLITVLNEFIDEWSTGRKRRVGIPESMRKVYDLKVTDLNELRSPATAVNPAIDP